MARKTTRKKTTRRKKPVATQRRFRWLWKLILLAVIAAAIGVAMLDVVVRDKFEGAKWALPAHVYSRSLDIFHGLPLSQDQLRWELDQLGYRQAASVNRPGQYRVTGSTIELYTRGFRFWDGDEPARHVAIAFSGGKVDWLRADNGLVRLEPMLIGGIYPAHQEDRVLVRLEELPPYLVDGLLAVEDQDFYRHWGLSPKGIARAFISNLRAGAAVQGGSTITQQLVKNLYLSQERSLIRKGVEAVMAVLLEMHYSKADILETYINEVYLGQSGTRAIHGFGMASRHLFRQPVGELDLHQVALMIGMVKGASYYDPWRNPERARSRRNLVIDVMAGEGVVSRDEAGRAKNRGLDIAARPGTSTNPYPAYFELVRQQLDRDYQESDLRSAGLRIFTYLDPQVQRQMESSMGKVVDQLEKDYRMPANELQAASVMLRAGTGDVLAMTGDRKAGFAGFNRALEARRQIGSVVKPAVYLAALEQHQRYTLGTLIDDAPLALDMPNGSTWKPENYERRSHGQVPLYHALGHSYNQATAHLGLEVGLDRVADTLRRLGVERSIPELPSLLLGSLDLTPYEVASMYHTIAAEGFHAPLRAINAVYTADNEPLRRYPFETRQQFTPEVMHLLHYALQVVMREGTGKTVYRQIPRDVSLAGKTGTTNDQRDSWFAGFADQYVGVVWLGRDDNGKTPLTGATGALRVWTDMMAGLNVGSIPFAQPEGIEYHWVEPHNQRLSGEGCPGARYLPYIRGSEPKTRGPCYRSPNDNVIDWFKDIFGR